MWRKCLAAPSRELTLRERVLDMRATKGVTLVQTSYVERERERERQTDRERERERERQRERENRSVNLLILLGWELC